MEDDTPMEVGDENGEDWVRLVSNDGFSFLVKRKVANMSGTIRNSLDPLSSYAESETKTYHHTEDRGIIVQKLIEYMSFKAHYSKVKGDVPINELLERLPPEIVLEVLLAADYHEL
ncbi:POZ domain-containing protein [Marasmius fiardii PR-910]|nr:POZ domain-containing protein [Marasmius fiardii PR-910]